MATRTALLGSAVVGCLALGVLSRGAGPAAVGRDTPRWRQPIALVLSSDGKRLYAANRRAGSITLVDTAARRVVGEAPVGRSLADLTATPDGRLLTVDEDAGELIVLVPKGDGLTVERRVPVAAAPVCVRISANGARWYVASLWTHRVTVLEDDGRRSAQVIDVPFAPRALLPLPGGTKLLIADSFGGRVAVADGRTGKVESMHALDAHNIRGAALAGGEVLLAHQVLTARTPTTAEEIHWGNVVHQGIRALPVEGLQTPGADALRGSRLLPLGDPGRGAGDPVGLAVGGDGTIVVALGGVGEIAFGKEQDAAWTRLAVGQRPTAVALSADGRSAYVADTFGDAVAFVDLPGRKVAATVALGARPPLSDAERGERLFYDARLSHEGWFSCHSCHTDGHTNGLLSDTLSDGGFGAPKRVLTLLGTKDTGPWTWIGGMPDLESQVKKSILTTMRGPRAEASTVRDLTAYLGTLVPPPPIRRAEAAAVQRGRDVFEARGCAKCHAPPTYTTPKTYDVGLRDEANNRTFNPPSLRGVSQGGPYLHDGRAATLEDVFTRHTHPGPEPLPRGELKELVRFLRSL